MIYDRKMMCDLNIFEHEFDIMYNVHVYYKFTK